MIPTVKALSLKLQGLCLFIISIYLIFIMMYCHISLNPFKHSVALDMLHSAIISTVITLIGGLLLDCEIRLYENKHKP